MHTIAVQIDQAVEVCQDTLGQPCGPKEILSSVLGLTDTEINQLAADKVI